MKIAVIAIIVVVIGIVIAIAKLFGKVETLDAIVMGQQQVISDIRRKEIMEDENVCEYYKHRF